MKYPIAIAALTACWLTLAAALGQDYYNSGEFARFMSEGDAMIQAQQHQPAPPVKQYDPEAAVAAGIKPSPPIQPRPEGYANVGNAEWAYRHALDRYNQELDRYNNALGRWAQQEEEHELEQVSGASLEVQAQLYSQRLDSLLGMAPAEPGEDLNARRDELNRRIAQLTDPETIGQVQIILDRLEPVEKQLRAEADAKAKAQAKAKAGNALDQRRAQDEAPKTVSITQSVSIRLTYGATVLPIGTKLEFVSRDGSEVRIRYMGAEYVIPVSATDLK